jgi:D-alanine-D-alanine ligase
MARKLQVTVLFEPSDNVTPEVEPPKRKHRRRAGRRPKVEKKEEQKLDREEVFDAVVKSGHAARWHELQDKASLLSLARSEADLVFNLTEAFDGDDTKDFHVAAFLELIGKRYTGAGPRGLYLAQDKALAKKIFSFHGIRMPAFAVSYRGKLDYVDDLSLPLIVKPATEDGSVGIDCGSVVNSVKELMERLSYIQETFDCPALVEEFIEGREIYVGVLGNDKPRALPAVELDLSKLPKDMPRIAGKEVKWDKGTDAYELTKSAAAQDLSDEIRKRLAETAVATYRALKLRDYGRIDMRLKKDGSIYVIEANPNPWLAGEAELAIAAREAGKSYTELIGEIVDLAMAREP